MHFPGLPRRSLQAQGQAQTQGQNQERNQEQNQEQKQLHTSRLSLSKFHTPQSHSSSKRIRSCFSLPLIVILACLLPTLTTAWPYVDCSGSSPIFSLTSVTTHFDPTAESINLVLQGNFSNLYQYPAAETSQWRTSIVTTILGTMLHRSEGPACEMITGDCPTASGPGLISTNFTISQNAPFAELLVSMQIINRSNQSIVCVAVLLEQNMKKVNTAVSFLPLALALYSGFISLVSMIMRATVGTGFMSSVGTYGLTSETLSVHTPGLFDIIFYTQFIVMTGQLSVNYPSFYQTFTSLFHWSFLQFRNSLAGDGPENSSDVLTYGGAGSVNQIKGAYQSSGSMSNFEKQPSLPDLDLMNEFANTLFTPKQSPFMIDITSSPSPIFSNDPHLRKRQAETVSPTLPSPSPSVTTTSTTTTTKNEPKPTSSRSSSRSKPRPVTDPPSSTTATLGPTKTTTTTTALIIPTINDPFNNNNQGSRYYNASRYGMEAYAAAIGAYPSNLFLCTLINTFIAGGISLFMSAIILLITWFRAKENHQKGKTLQHATNFVTGNLLRTWFLFYTPMALSAMYQLTISGGTVMLVIASISLLMCSVGIAIFLTWRIFKASTQFLLFEDLKTLLRYGPVYNTLVNEGTLFFLVTLLKRFLWGLAVAMLSSYGVAQVAILMLVELGYVLVIGVKWPYADSGDNKFHLLLGFIRLVVTGCSAAYVHDLNASPEARQIFGYIQMALHLITFIIMFALILWNTIQVFMFWQARHTIGWQGPTKNYSFEDGVGTLEHGWTMAGRPISLQHHHHHRHQRRSEPPIANLHKTRRYTIQPYSSVTSVGDLGSLSRDDLIRHRSLYHRAHQPSNYRSPVYPADEMDRRTGLSVDLRPEIMVAQDSTTGPISALSLSPIPHSLSVDSVDGPAIQLQPTQLSSIRFQPPPRESYAKFQRMTHQQETTPDFRSRRMSEIFRDGRYLYNPNGTSGSTLATNTAAGASTASAGKRNGGVLQSIKGLLGFSKQGAKTMSFSSEGSKSKAFEVIRPVRPPAVSMDTADDISQAGGVRELNSLGISRFFEESGRNNEQKRNLFVANPEALASQTGSLASDISGIPSLPNLQRPASEAASDRTTNASRLKSSQKFSTDLISALNDVDDPSVGASGSGDTLEPGQRASLQQRHMHIVHPQPTYARNPVENHIAEALRSDTPVKLHGGEVLKVSRGPEKSVQYWSKEAGRYVPSAGNSTTASSIAGDGERRGTPLPIVSPPLLLLPSTTGFLDHTQVDDSGAGVGGGASSSSIKGVGHSAPSIKSRAGSRPESPTESHYSSNVAASAERMHEILDRMFSDQDGEDSDTISEGDSVSTFSGRISATILALHQKQCEREQEESFSEAQSMYRAPLASSEMSLQTVPEHHGDGSLRDDKQYLTRPGARRTVSTSGKARLGHGPGPGTLMRTLSGPTTGPVGTGSGGGSGILRASKSGSLARPLAQTPLHSLSVLPFSASMSSLQMSPLREELVRMPTSPLSPNATPFSRLTVSPTSSISPVSPISPALPAPLATTAMTIEPEGVSALPEPKTMLNEPYLAPEAVSSKASSSITSLSSAVAAVAPTSDLAISSSLMISSSSTSDSSPMLPKPNDKPIIS